MCLKSKYFYSICVMGMLVLFSTSCDKITLPRLSFEDKPTTRLPKTVTYAFSSDLVNYSKTVDACGFQYTIPVGKIVADTFMRIGQDRFNGVRAEPPVGDAQGTPPDGYRVRIEFNQFGFDPFGRSPDEERYTAILDLGLLAVYENSAGTALAQTPLTYHENVSLFTPAITSQSTSCSTNAIDGAVEGAAETLAKEMASVMPRLGQPIEANPIQPQVNSRPTQTPVQAPTQTYRQQAISPSVQFRTKLVDANRNLVLESGETIVLLIETTNISDTDIPSAYVELGGTPALVKAFKHVVSLPVPLGSFKAGEKRTAEIRGRLGSTSEASQGELIIGIILSEGVPPGKHTIRAEIRPGRRKSSSR